MSYLGNAPARSVISFERQVFSIVNSQTAYALSHSVTNENDIRLVVNNVVQEPGSGKAYTATGTALTLSAALTNGTDEMYCVFLGRATATNAPGAGSVGTVQLADNATTLAKMASGTDGNIISYDASGNPVAVATGNDGQVLTSAGAGAPPVFETPASAVNTPTFNAYKQGDQGGIQPNTATKVTGWTEINDSDGKFASGRFTPTVAGQYFIYASAWVTANSDVDNPQIMIYKNGSDVQAITFKVPGAARNIPGQTVAIVTSDTNDYFEVFVQSAATATAYSSGDEVRFGGFKIIT